MGDLLEYFEAQSRNLDNKGASSKSLYTQDSKFISCIRFNGIPILPPVMTPRRREEMKSYRRLAMKRENHRKSKQREQLVAKVQSIVAEVEEQRAARREDSVPSSPIGSDTSSSRVSPSQPIKSFPSFPFSTQNRNKSEENSKGVAHNSALSNERKIEDKVVTRKEQTRSKPDIQILEQTQNVRGQSSKSTTKHDDSGESISQKSRVGNQQSKEMRPDKKARQKNSQIPTPKKEKREGAMSNLKRARSMSSLPNLAKIEGVPVPKPPSSPMTKQQYRRAQLTMSGQFSISQPDLRDIDKSDSENSISCRSNIEESPSKKREKLLMSSQYSVSNPDLTDLSKMASPSDNLKEQSKSSPKSKLKSSTSTPNLTMVGRRSKRRKSKDNRDSDSQENNRSKTTYTDHGKSEMLDTDLKQKEAEVQKTAAGVRLLERQENSEVGLETLSDFASLEDNNSLPQEFGGLPLSTYGQQQIAQSLAKLTKCLNIEDTLSTMTSTGSEHDNTELKQPIPIVPGRAVQEMAHQKSSPTHRGSGNHSADSTSRGRKLPTIPHDVTSDESSLSHNHTSSSHNSSVASTDHGSGSTDNRSHLSAASASIMSSGGSVNGSQVSRRMSPKGGKSKVHFSSFLTEISTSASQSLEGKISVRKLDITPQSSIDFTENLNKAHLATGQSDTGSNPLTLKMGAKNFQNLGSNNSQDCIEEQPDSMLGRVALSPETSDSPGTPNEYNFGKNGIPFHGYSGEVDYNTSDKENEYVNKMNNINASEGFTQAKSFRETSASTSSSKNGAVVNDSQTVLTKNNAKMWTSDDGSQCSTLKASQDLLHTKESNNNTQSGSTIQSGTSIDSHVAADTHQYGTISTDIEKYMRGSGTSGSEEATLPQQLLNSGHSNNPVASKRGGNYGNQPPTEESYRTKQLNIQPSGSSEPRVSPSKDSKDSPVESDANPTFRKGHVRKGSYTLPQASPALLQAASQNFTASNSPRTVQRRLNMDDSDPRITQQQQQVSGKTDQQNISYESSTEQHGKAQHIQRYLSQLQNHHTSPSANVPDHMTNMAANIPIPSLDVSGAIQSFTDSLKSVEDMSEEELLKIQAEHFDKIRKFLVEQQKQQLEELFVHQRREQLQLQNEIEVYHQQLKDQQDVSTLEHSPENNAVYGADRPVEPYDVHQISGIFDPGQTQESQQTTKAYPYISSPSLYFNPRDRDNGSDISTFSKATPKQSLQFNINQSTPSPKPYNPVVRSPIKNPSLPRVSNRMVIPERLRGIRFLDPNFLYSYPLQVHDPDIKPYFDRVSACVKGYLTRRLLRTEKVQEIIKTIRDTKNFAYSFQAETPIKRGNFTMQDRNLLDRIIAQLQAALLDIHEIFFIIPVSERMNLIAHSRQLMEERRLRDSNVTRSSVSSSQPRVSSATLKAIERKRRANDTELTVFGDMNLRPRSAPLASDGRGTRSTHQNHSIDLRALRPVSSHGQNAEDQGGIRQATREKTKSSTAQGSNKYSIIGAKAKKPTVSTGKTTTKTTNTKAKTFLKPKMKPASAWR